MSKIDEASGYNIRISRKYIKPLGSAASVIMLLLISGFLACHVNINGNFLDFWYGALSIIIGVAAIVMFVITLCIIFDQG